MKLIDVEHYVAGLDSLETGGLLIDLEDSFNAELPDAPPTAQTLSPSRRLLGTVPSCMSTQDRSPV